MKIDKDKNDKQSDKKKMISIVIFVFLIIDIIVLLIFLLNHFNKGIVVESSSSVEEPSSSEVISSSEETSSTSEYDPYVDTVISNIKKYIKEVSEDRMGVAVSMKDLYSINTYVDSESTHLVYGFTYLENEDEYVRLDINLEQELDIEQIISLIHDDGITLDQYYEHTAYDIVNEDITSKDSFKDIYHGDYTHHICYKDEYDMCYMSGIGKNDDTYISIDLLSFDKDTYDIDDTDTSINQRNDINKRYYQLLFYIALGL